MVIDCDDGHTNLASKRLVPTSWSDIEDIHNLLVRDAGSPKPQYRQVIIDTMTTFTLMASQHYAEQRGVQHHGEVDHGAGYGHVRGRIQNMITKFKNLGLGIIFVAHTREVEEKGKVSRWVPWMHDETFHQLDALTDVAMFFDVAIGPTGEETHKIRVKPSNRYYAKDRMNLYPDEMPMEYWAFRNPIVRRWNEQNPDNQIELLEEVSSF